jgi:hypothetical protein
MGKLVEGEDVTEREQAERVDGVVVQTVQAKKAHIAFVTRDGATWFVRFLADGTMEVNPSLTAEENARGFWRAAEIVRRQVLISGMSKAIEAIERRCAALVPAEGVEDDSSDAARSELISLRHDLEREIVEIARAEAPYL